MTILEKAIICTPTYESAEQLDNFIREHTNRYVPLDAWYDYGEATCWDLYEEDSDHRLVNMSYESYIHAIREFDEDGDNVRYIPEDPALRFIDVATFISLCMGMECPEEDIEVGDIL